MNGTIEINDYYTDARCKGQAYPDRVYTGQAPGTGSTAIATAAQRLAEDVFQSEGSADLVLEVIDAATGKATGGIVRVSLSYEPAAVLTNA